MATPLRVASILPSATDTILFFGLGANLIARSHECNDETIQSLPSITSSRVGSIPIEEIDAAFSASVAAVVELQSLGVHLAIPLLSYGLSVYNLDTAALAELRPDVIVTCLQTAHGSILEGELLERALYSVLGYVPKVVHCAAGDYSDVYRDMQNIADALGEPQKGRELIEKQQKRIEYAHQLSLGRHHPKVVCIQWPFPLMACCSWVPELIAKSGGIDVAGKPDEAVVLTAESLLSARPDVVIFALCGLDLDTACKASINAIRKIGNDAWSKLPAVKAGRIAVLDGEKIFSRPGPLLIESVECLVEILHPEAQSFGHRDALWRWLGTVA